jgi:hypothetical protein
MTSQLFPAPFPDETVYSWICRFHFFAGHADFKKVTLRLLGVNDSRPANEFPPYLSKLAEISGKNLEEILFEQTNIHYFQPFMDDCLYKVIVESILKGDTWSIQSRIGAVANRITPGQLLKYCPICAQNDLEQYGTPYWHRCHQLVGVTACVIHGVLLQSIKRVSKRPILPPLAGSIQPPSEVELKLSELVGKEIIDIEAVWQKCDTYEAYYRRLKVMGFLTQTGRIRQHLLALYLEDRLKPFTTLASPFPQLYDAVRQGKYPECLFYRLSCNHQPIKHFVFILSLFDSWDGFKKTVIVEETIFEVKKVTEQLKGKPINWNLAVKQVSDGMSLRAVAKLFGTTVSTLKIKAVQNHVAVDRRPSKITSDIERAIWRKLFMGMKTQDVALEFDLSVGAIEKVLTLHLGLKLHRKHIWYSDDFYKHKLCISEFLLANPNATRNQIRKEVRASYYWLYKHEKEWLYKTIPERVKAIYWPRKI